jgi:hypothetical protein
MFKGRIYTCNKTLCLRGGFTYVTNIVFKGMVYIWNKTLCLRGGFTYVTNIMFKREGLHM